MADGDISLPTNIFTSKEFIAIVVVISLSIIVKFTLGSYENKTIIFIMFEIILYIILAYIFIANLLYLLFGIEITTTIYNTFTDNPTIEIDIETEVEDVLNNTEEEEKKDKRQVFHVSGNKYRYEDAEPICKALGAELATYDNIEESYNNGGEWCGYGWSEGQMAFFPTQKETWDKLQKFPKKKNNCGRPGVNGGYIDNPYIKFGVNCYGKKPKPTENDLKRLESQQEHPVPLTAEDKELQKKINYWKENSDKLKLNSFNNNNWSRY